MATELRVVTDILGGGADEAPIAFDQIGEEAGLYQPICPWCGEDIGDRVTASRFGELYVKCAEYVLPHIFKTSCADATKLKVRQG